MASLPPLLSPLSNAKQPSADTAVAAGNAAAAGREAGEGVMVAVAVIEEGVAAGLVRGDGAVQLRATTEDNY